MKVLERGQTPAGADLVLVDWSENYPNLHEYGDTIHAYPIAKESAKGQFEPKRGDRFLLQLRCKSGQEARRVFERLKAGELVLKDCKKYACRMDKKYIDII